MSSIAAAAHSGAERRLGSDAPALAASVVVALPLAGLLWLSGAVAFPAAVAAMALLVFVVMTAGMLLLRAARASDMPAPAAWVLGVFATALAVFALVALFDILAVTAFGIWAAAVALLRVYAGRARFAVRPVDASEIVALLLCAAATAFWCGELAAAADGLARDGVLATWTDQFIHGSVISQFGDPRAAGRGMIELVDVPLAPYHFASYMLPAILAWPLDMPGLALATSVWAPLGFFTACAGAYTLGAALGGRAAGFAALGAVTLLPDAASYGLHNRLFGYFWYVIAVPSASYGVGVALVAMAFLKRWAVSGERRALLASACLIAGSLLLRVHLFVLALPAWLACVAFATPVVRPRKLAFAGGALAAFGLLVWGFYRSFPGFSHALELFLDVTHFQQSPTAYTGLYHWLSTSYGPQVTVPAGVALVFPAFLGVFLLLYPVSLLLLRGVRRLDVADAAPGVVLLCYLLLLLTAPVPAHGDATEFTQRPFVLAYAMVAVWTAANFAGWIQSHGGLTQRRTWLPLLLAACLAVVLALRYTVRDARWSYAYRVAEGLPRAAAFVRSHAQQGDVLAAQGLHPGLVVTDLSVQVVSLTGLPAYLARPFMHIESGGRRGEAALQRYGALGAVEREQSAATALERLRALGVRWYVVAESDRSGPKWDPRREHAVFVDRMVAVYAVPPGAR